MLTELQSRIISSRIDDFSESFLNPRISDVQKFDLMPDANKASIRITNAIINNEQILIFTDYDCDGCTSMAILYKILTEFYKANNVSRLSGNRNIDGYGLSNSISEKIREINPDLIITADCGISDTERISFLNSLGFDIIITDHHLIPSNGIPKDAYAVINPQRDDWRYKNREIAGCAVSWLLMANTVKYFPELKASKLLCYLDYVAIGTIADMVPVNSITNRYLIKKGLEILNKKLRPSWYILPDNIDAQFIGFQLAPRINASSRVVSNAEDSINYLLSGDVDSAYENYNLITEYNNSRKVIESQMSENINTDDDIIIYYNQDNNPGVQGILAGKIANEHKKLVILLADAQDGILVASGRSGNNIHIRNALEKFDILYPNILISYGGHFFAAGFSLYKKDLDVFISGFKQIISSMDNNILSEVLTDGIIDNTLESYKEIEELEPYGMGFKRPKFHIIAKPKAIKVLGKDNKHISFTINKVKAIWFNCIKDGIPINTKTEYKFIYALNLNEYNGKSNIQLMIQDVINI